MYTEDLLVDDGSEWEAVECSVEGIVDSIPFRFEGAQTLQPETALPIRLYLPIDIRQLVVASEEKDFCPCTNLVNKQPRDHLNRIIASVHIIPEEKQFVGQPSHPSCRVESVQIEAQVIVVSMDIAKYVDRAFKLQQLRLQRHKRPDLVC